MKIDTKIELIRKDISYIRKAIEGNGEIGLIKATKLNTDYRIGETAKSKLTRWFFGGSGVIALVIIIIKSVV